MVNEYQGDGGVEQAQQGEEGDHSEDAVVSLPPSTIRG